MTKMADGLSRIIETTPSSFTFSLFHPNFKTLKPNSSIQLPVPNHTNYPSSSSSNCLRRRSNRSLYTVPSDLHILSTSECCDGSFVFRFGEASELETSRELDDDKRQVVVETIQRDVSSSGKELGVGVIHSLQKDSRSCEATVSQESAQAQTVGSPVSLESTSILMQKPEITEVKELRSGDPTDVSNVGVVEQLTENYMIGKDISTTNLYISSGAALLPHPSKALAGGEESYFINNLNWLGVADGVGQWSLEGTNPGVYARELMENCVKIVSNADGILRIHPVEVLKRSVEEAQSPGSSTVLVAYFDGQTLHVANIGDSGFIIIRDGSVHRTSSPMHHEFHFPLQIAKGHNPFEVVEEYKIDLENSDIIVIATDGLLDNLYKEEIASIVSKAVQASINPQEIAKLLGRRAQEVGNSAFAKSPFADSARAAGYTNYTGGKLDDVAVIVSLVQKRLN